MIKVLIVDDSALMRRLLGDILRAHDDIEPAFARNGLEALHRLHAFRPDVVTLDVTMPEMDGIACLDRIMLERPCPVVMLSALTEAGAAITAEALALGAIDFIPKPAGAVSLAIADLAPVLVGKIRMAAKARLRQSLRLTERVRLRGQALPTKRAPATPTALAGSRALALPEFGPGDGAVLVGTSTGGPAALDVLLSALPADFGWPVLVAQHMPEAFTAPLARRLDKLCALNVIEVSAPAPLVPGTVYIGRGDTDIIVARRAGGLVVLSVPMLAEHRWHPSVNRLVTTAIEQLGAARLIGILMTGMGNDGADAMTRLRREGGRTIAEAEETAIVWGMPGELVKAGGADVVAPLDRIAEHLLGWVA